MSFFIATLAPERTDNWKTCKEYELWGVIGATGGRIKNAEALRVGDTIFVWRGGKQNGFIARLTATSRARFSDSSDFKPPWDNPELFSSVMSMRVEKELRQPIGDSFTAPKRDGIRFGFNNTVLQHGFVEIGEDVGQKINEAVDRGR